MQQCGIQTLKIISKLRLSSISQYESDLLRHKETQLHIGFIEHHKKWIESVYDVPLIHRKTEKKRDAFQLGKNMIYWEN